MLRAFWPPDCPKWASFQTSSLGDAGFYYGEVYAFLQVQFCTFEGDLFWGLFALIIQGISSLNHHAKAAFNVQPSQRFAEVERSRKDGIKRATHIEQHSGNLHENTSSYNAITHYNDSLKGPCDAYDPRALISNFERCVGYRLPHSSLNWRRDILAF